MTLPRNLQRIVLAQFWEPSMETCIRRLLLTHSQPDTFAANIWLLLHKLRHRGHVIKKAASIIQHCF